MPTLESPPEDELAQQSDELTSALTTAVTATAAAFATELGAGAISSLATTAIIPGLWAAQVEGTALSLVLDAYLDAAGLVLETIDPGRHRGFSLISDSVAQQFIDSVRTQFVTLGSELEQRAHTAMQAALKAGATVSDTVAQIIQAIALPVGRIVLAAQTAIRAAIESATLAQVRALGDLVRVTRTWKSRHDERTRSWHRAASGQTIGLSEAFHVGDSWLQAPSVPAPGRSFDVGDLCNCRCIVRYGLDIITTTNNASNVQETSMVVPQPDEPALIASTAKWSPSAHPRGKDGKFIHKGALSTLLSTNIPDIVHIISGVTELTQSQWNNLTDAQKTYIKSNVEKLPHSSGTYKTSKAKLGTLEGITPDVVTPSATPTAQIIPSATPVKAIPAHKGAAPGTPAKVSTALAWGKYDDGDVILESANGSKRVIWNGKVKKYATQEKLSDGTWQSTKFESKKDFYANNKGDDSYVVPGSAVAVTAVPELAPAPKPVPSAVSTPNVEKPTTPTPMPSGSVTPSVPATPVAGISELTFNNGTIDWFNVSNAMNAGQIKPDSIVAVSYNNPYRITAKGDGNFALEQKVNGLWSAVQTDSNPSKLAANVGLANSWILAYNLQLKKLKTLKGEDGEFTLSASIVGKSALKHILETSPPGSVLATNTPGPYSADKSKQRLVKTDTGALEMQKLNQFGEWKPTTVAPVGMITHALISDYKWTISNEAIPAVTKPSGTVVNDWAAQLHQNFAEGDVIATHESGFRRLVRGKNSTLGSMYDVEVLDPASGKWSPVPGESSMLDASFIDGLLNFTYPGAWIAGKPSSIANSTDKPNVLSTAPGGVPLQYTDEDVISVWSNILNIANHSVDDVIAVHSDGNYRIVANGFDEYDASVYTVETWNKATGKWIPTSYDSVPASDIEQVIAPGDWLVALPNGNAYPPKSLTTPASIPVVPTPVSTVNTTTNPLGNGSDITGMPMHVKTAMKATLKPGKIGYWSKPEKIWDSIKEIQDKYPDSTNPGHSQYSAAQVLKALDSTLKTSAPSPFETKITKWAASPSGQAYIKKSLVQLGTPNVSTAVPTVTPSAPSTTVTSNKFPNVMTNLDYSMAWSQGKPVNSSQIVSLLDSSDHLNVVAVHVKGSIEHRIVRSTNDPDTGEMRFYVQQRNNVNTEGWDVATVPGMPSDGLLKTASDLNKYFPNLKFRSVEGVTSATPTVTPTAVPSPPSVPINVGSDDISHLTPTQKSNIYSSFKKQSNTFLSSPDISVFNALKTVAATNNLSVMQVLKTVDSVGAEKIGVENGKLFEKKISAWLATKQGTLIASGQPLSKLLTRKVPYSPGVSASDILNFADSSKLTYSDMTVKNAHKFDQEVLKMSNLPAEQISALKTYTGGSFIPINKYLYGAVDVITPINAKVIGNIQKGMRPSNQPILLHRGVNFDGVANSTSFEDLKTKVGQTWVSGGFFSSSVGGKPAFSGKQVHLEIEAPPGTPMAWMEHLIESLEGKKPLTKYPGEKEMLLAAGLSYRIVSVSTDSTGKAVVRVRVVPPSEKVTL